MIRLSRRQMLLAAGMMPLAPRAFAATPIGEATEITGAATLTRDGTATALEPGTPLMEGDTAATGEEALALLILQGDTRINMGSSAQVVLEKYLADVGGTITVGGAIVFDRPEDLPKTDLTFATAFGQIGVRGTRFFVGESRGAYAAFCHRGSITVTLDGREYLLGPGDGVNLSPGETAPEVAKWAEPRIVEAFASVGLTP
jgi:hypothetical protein